MVSFSARRWLAGTTEIEILALLFVTRLHNLYSRPGRSIDIGIEIAGGQHTEQALRRLQTLEQFKTTVSRAALAFREVIDKTLGIQEKLQPASEQCDTVSRMFWCAYRLMLTLGQKPARLRKARRIRIARKRPERSRLREAEAQHSLSVGTDLFCFLRRSSHLGMFAALRPPGA